MPNFSYHWKGVEEALNKIDLIKYGTHKSLDIAATAAARPVVNEWKKEIVAQRAIRTRTYLRSVQKLGVRHQGDAVYITIGTDITDPPYPFFLEFGTHKADGTWKIHPRHIAGNAWDRSVEKALKEFRKVYITLFKKMAA